MEIIEQVNKILVCDKVNRYLLVYDKSKYKVIIYRDTTIDDRLLLKNIAADYLNGKSIPGNQLVKELNQIIEYYKKTDILKAKI